MVVRYLDVNRQRHQRARPIVAIFDRTFGPGIIQLLGISVVLLVFLFHRSDILARANSLVKIRQSELRKLPINHSLQYKPDADLYQTNYWIQNCYLNFWEL